MAEEKTLPGCPKKKRVKEVKSHLWSYGIRPSIHRLWTMTWSWAHEISISHYRQRWPLPSEIASMYVFLLFLEMKQNFSLKLPHKAMERMTPAVLQHLALTQKQPGLPSPAVIALMAPEGES